MAEKVHAWEKFLADDTREWISAADPREVALALSLGARCIQALPELASQKSRGSSEKGAQGEAEMYELLSKAYGTQMRNVSHRARSCDLVCESRSGPVRIEVKNYASSVPSAEIDKFLRDLRDSDASAGVMLSLASPIVGVKNSFSIALEPRVSTGSIVPVVYAAAGRGEKLNSELALAAVEIAICLAEVYPSGVRSLHGRDAMLTYATAADQLAEGVASVKSDLSRLASGVSDGMASLGEKVLLLGRETRTLARGLRNDAEEISETSGEYCESLVERFCKKYVVHVSQKVLLDVVNSVENCSGFIAGILGEESRWRLLSDRAVHSGSGCTLAFLKAATEIKFPAQYASVEKIAQLLTSHSKKVKFANGELSLELDDSTLADALALLTA